VHSRQNLEDDLNYIRSQLDLIVGETNWYDAPVDTISGINYRIDNLSGGTTTFLDLTDTYIELESYTANNTLYTSSSGVHDTDAITYDSDTGDVRVGADGGARVMVDASESTIVYGDDDTYVTISGGNNEFIDGGTLRMSLTDAGLALTTGARVNDIQNDSDGDTLDASSTDAQLVTAKLVYDTIISVSGTIPSSHEHYELDLTLSGSNVWTATSGTVASMNTDNMDVYLNGLLNRDHTDYFTALVEGSKLTVTFAYNTYESDWAHVKFWKDQA
jgi:hypothetical protein